jgi:hypothetical protein
MSRYIEIYSGNRNRNEYPLVSMFEIPYNISVIDNSDPVINGAIYYKWKSEYILDTGFLSSNTTNSTPIIPPINSITSKSQPTEFNAYNGFNFYDFNTFTLRTIISYDPSTLSITLNRNGIISSSDLYSIYDGSTNSVIHIPYIDDNGNQLETIDRIYDDYYVMDETLSYGLNIVAKKITKYDGLLRLAYLETPMPSSWNVNDSYTLRKSLPVEKWTLDVLTFINNDFSYGPIGPVITFPNGASNVNGYYRGKYVYFSSNNPLDFKNNFKPIYGNFYIKEYKVTYLGGGNYKREAFVDYDSKSNLPYFKINDGLFLTGTNNITQYLSNVYSKEDDYYRNYILLNVTTNEKRIITFYNGLTKETTVDVPFTSCNPGDVYKIITPNTINIVSLSHNNYSPLDYNGTLVSQNNSICYEVSLIEIILPNVNLKTGSKIVFYPYVYVELSSISASQTYSKNIIYSNNPNSGRALFTAAITDVVAPEITSFIKPNCVMTQIVKFKPNDNFRFSVYLPNGKLFETIEQDLFSPYEPNSKLQIHATFSIKRLDTNENDDYNL